MRQDDRSPFAEALEAARRAAYPPGQYVGQESFMPADGILDLARRAGIGPGVRVLDVCCGVAGPGRLISAELGCDYLGVDGSEGAIELARARTRHLPCRFVVGHVPPVPAGPFDVVLLLETVLAFADKPALLRSVASALAPGGRFAFTLEEGEPLTPAERRAMPDADTVHLVPFATMTRLLADAGLAVTWQQDVTASHLVVARALHAAYAAGSDAAAAVVGERAVRELVDAHRLWVDWMASGRVRKIAAVASVTTTSASDPDELGLTGRTGPTSGADIPHLR